MWVELRDERDLTGTAAGECESKKISHSISHQFCLHHHLRLANVLQINEATQQASYLFQYTVKIIVQRPKEIQFKSVMSSSSPAEYVYS